MAKLKIKKIERYTVGYSVFWIEPYLEKLIGLIKTPAASQQKVLGGRRKVGILSPAPGIDLAVKQYARGGLMGHVIKKTYFKWGKPRCQKEFEWLWKAGRMGIRAPEPVVFIFQGRCFYRCWLIVSEIKNHQSLAELTFSSDSQTENIFYDLASQVGVLIRNQILHVDLHPGNVLIDEKGLVHIIDFDKAHIFSGDISKLTARYISRWSRAVDKHRLNPLLATAFQEALLIHMKL